MARIPRLNEEKPLLLQLKRGSYGAFETVYHRYKEPLAAFMLRLVKSQDLAEDLLQELFVRLWEHRASVDPDQPIKGYLFRIAENLAYDTFRRLAKDRQLQDDVYQALQGYGEDVEEDIFSEENRMVVEAAIAKLPPKRRKVFMLCKIESKSYEEVSACLNISLSTINDHIYKANRFLKQYLTDHVVSILVTLHAALGCVCFSV